jgi:hypothetical protein
MDGPVAPTEQGSSPWAVPDSRPSEPRPPASPAVVAGTGAAAVARRRPLDTPTPLRALSTGDRLDGGLRILQLAPAKVLALAALAVVPVSLLSALSLGGRVPDASPEADAAFGQPLVALLAGEGEVAVYGGLLLLVESLGLSFVAAGLGVLATGWYLGVDRSLGDLVRTAARRLPALAVAGVLVHVLEAVAGIAGLVPAIFPMALFAVVAPIIAVEQLGPIAAMRRSSALTRRLLSQAMSTVVAVAIVDFLLRAALAGSAIAYVGTELPAGRTVVAVTAMLARLVTVPFVAGAAVMLYLDLRVRLEGLDIVLAADERLPVAS